MPTGLGFMMTHRVGNTDGIGWISWSNAYELYKSPAVRTLLCVQQCAYSASKETTIIGSSCALRPFLGIVH
jgi:hypothetical protein